MSIATTYNFDSVGDTLPTLREHEKVSFESTEIVFNPRTPLTLSKESTEFFVMNKKVFDYISDDQMVFEREPLQNLAKDGQLMAFKHEGFWQCMDTLRDKELLNKIIKSYF